MNDYPAYIRPDIDALETSKIREVADLGMAQGGVVALWFGEGDLPTPRFIVDAAKEGLDERKVFYTENRGTPALREALARYLSRQYALPVSFDRVSVTSSGMSAFMVVMEALIGPGDNAVVVTPIWPNCRESVHIMGGETRCVVLDFGDEGWSLDLDSLFDAVDERTRAFVINSPSNPTGWMMHEDQQKAVLDFARERGIWVIADEVYDRLTYTRPRAPSFLDFAGPDDPVIGINSFSKAWCMTGWRLGWLVTPPQLGPLATKLIEYNYSCPTAFVQHAGITALEHGEDFITELVERYRQGRDLVHQRLSAIPRVRMARPEAAFYAFFEVDGMDSSVELAKHLVRDHKVGLAPGAAFGPGGDDFLRLCFASTTENLSLACDRIEAALG